MNTTDDKTLTTADLAAAADQREHARREQREEHRDDPDQRSMRDADPRDAAMREAQMRQPPMHEQGMPRPGAAGGQELQGERLAPLFLPQIAERFRSRWDEVQIGFVDDPHQAVKQADELVAQVMKSLAETFAEERATIDGQVDQSDTEHLRVALRRYRSFFQRLLSL